MGAPPAEVIAAFDRLAAELRTRYLMTFPTPEHLPATAVVRVDTPGGPLTVTADVPAASAPDLSAIPTPLALTLALGILVLLATAATALVRYRPGRAAGRTPASAPDLGTLRTLLALASPGHPRAAGDRGDGARPVPARPRRGSDTRLGAGPQRHPDPACTDPRPGHPRAAGDRGDGARPVPGRPSRGPDAERNRPTDESRADCPAAESPTGCRAPGFPARRPAGGTGTELSTERTDVERAATRSATEGQGR